MRPPASPAATAAGCAAGCCPACGAGRATASRQGRLESGREDRPERLIQLPRPLRRQPRERSAPRRQTDGPW